MASPQEKTKSQSGIIAMITGKNRTPSIDVSDPSLNDEERKERREQAEAEAAKNDSVKSQIKKTVRKPKTLNQQAQAEKDKKLDDINHRLEQAADKVEIAEKGSKNLVSIITEYADANGDERFLLKEDGLVAGIQVLESLDYAVAKLKGLRKDAMVRMTTLGWESGRINLAVKERRVPKQIQLEMWETTRRETDKMHDLLEARGIARKGDDGEKKAKKARK